jgi:hypothetical protein
MTLFSQILRVKLVKAVLGIRKRGENYASRPINYRDNKHRSNEYILRDWENRRVDGASFWLPAYRAEQAILTSGPGVPCLCKLWGATNVQSWKLGTAGRLLLSTSKHESVLFVDTIGGRTQKG